MASDVDLNQFIIALVEAAYRSIKQATDDLTDEQLYYQPTAESNSIAWLVWHLSRWRDFISATISGEAQIWVSAGWAQRCGMPGERTGMGDTPAQVTAFRVERAVLFGYVDAAHHRIGRHADGFGHGDRRVADDVLLPLGANDAVFDEELLAVHDRDHGQENGDGAHVTT